jgi:sugar/nucleoside kinase (ribokinase family)
MPPEPAPPDRVDLLVVGALTIDRFADGTTAAGGSVLHAARAAAANGYAVGVVTVAGPEPEAATALRELTGLGTVHVQRAKHTLRFHHAETARGRELTVEQPAAPLSHPAHLSHAAAVLYAPVADELGADLVGGHDAAAIRTAILQGWLRSLEPGHRVDSLPLSAMSDMLVAVLSGFDTLIASREDLRAVAGSPDAQLDGLRARFGSTPRLVVTDGAAGAWLDDGGSRTRIVPRVTVRAAHTVGAGDAFAALITAELARGTALRPAAELATERVVRLLQSRSS